jgi:hypothetical protein
MKSGPRVVGRQDPQRLPSTVLDANRTKRRSPVGESTIRSHSSSAGSNSDGASFGSIQEDHPLRCGSSGW